MVNDEYIKKNFLNRKEFPLPTEKCSMKIVANEHHLNHVYICEWFPFKKDEYIEKNEPGDGYIGTAKVTAGMYERIGFHAWEQDNSEFIYYKVIE